MKKRSPYRPKYASNLWTASRTLATQPWRIASSLEPIETMLEQIERHGTVDSAQGEVIFRDCGSAHYYSMVPALRGVVEMFTIASRRKGWSLDLGALARLAKKLDVACPLQQSDIDAARAAIEGIRRHAPGLTLGEADDLVNTIKIREAMEKRGIGI